MHVEWIRVRRAIAIVIGICSACSGSTGDGKPRPDGSNEDVTLLGSDSRPGAEANGRPDAAADAGRPQGLDLAADSADSSDDGMDRPDGGAVEVYLHPQDLQPAEIDAAVDAPNDARVTLSGPSDFGTVRVPAEKNYSYTVTNLGAGPTGLLELTVDSRDFVITADLCSGHPLPAGQTCTFGIKFAPTTEGRRQAVLNVVSSGEQLVVLKLTGVGSIGSCPAPLRVSPPTLDFGETVVGESVGPKVFTVTYHPCGDAGSTTGSLSVVKKDSTSTVGGASQYDFTTTCLRELATGESCEIAVTYRPTVAGNSSAILTVSDGAVSSAFGTVVGTASAPPLMDASAVDSETIESVD